MKHQPLELAALGLVTHSDKHRYIDLGATENIDAVCRQVYLEQTSSSAGYEKLLRTFRPNAPRFMCFNDGDDAVRWIHVYPRSSKHVTRYWQAYAESQVLHQAGQLHILERGLLRHGVPLDLCQYSDAPRCSKLEQQLIGDIGAVYSFAKSGFDIEKLQLLEDSGLRIACELFMQAQGSRRYVRVGRMGNA